MLVRIYIFAAVFCYCTVFAQGRVFNLDEVISDVFKINNKEVGENCTCLPEKLCSPGDNSNTIDYRIGGYDCQKDNENCCNESIIVPNQTKPTTDGADNCTCVPYTDCGWSNNTLDNYIYGTISGSGKIESRSGGYDCQKDNEICCNESIIVTNQPTTDVADNCTCVPYTQCMSSYNTLEIDIRSAVFATITVRFSDQICPNYWENCCSDNRVVSNPINRPADVKRPIGCGILSANLDFELAENKFNVANFGELPWTVALLKTDPEEYFCTGSLIHPRVVLTAAHRVKTLEPNHLKVRAGEWDLQRTTERLPFQEINAQQIIMHPSFNLKNAANDLALVVVSQPFVLADHINVVCLPAPNVVPKTGETCLSSGWGRDKFESSKQYSAIMKRVALPVIEFNHCESIFRKTRLGRSFELDSSFICAGGQQFVDTCIGDGGGPLVCPADLSQNRYHQSGIVSWGIGCNDAIPAAYTNVALARNWIDEQMNSLGFGVASYSY